MAHISPQFIGLHPLHLAWRHRRQHPVHHGVMADAHQPLRRPQAHPFQIMRQGTGTLGGIPPAMILFPAGFMIGSTEPALPPMTAATVFHHRFASAMDAFHAPDYASHRRGCQYLLSNPEFLNLPSNTNYAN